MRRAIELSRLGVGRTSPNPAVGAVVARGDLVVGEGYHRRAGEPHAEALALRNAGDAARGADIYVTLEPCCHQGRTPPCTQAIIEAGIARVLFACPDPDPRCAGGGHAALQAAGIEVQGGVLAREAAAVNEAYLRHKRTGLPLVTLKLAMSLDGRIATRTGDSRWISGEQSRRLVHRMRDRHDAVMVGVGTVLADDPALTTRDVPGGRDALRVICDTQARTPPGARAIAQNSDAGCIVAVGEGAPPERLGALQAGVVDKVAFFYAAIIIGGEAAVSGVGGAGVETVADALRLSEVSWEPVGEDLLVRGRVNEPTWLDGLI
ncbi:MAG TPA: bifunctional diaminohydroxyphosphoribosylaminopyrimidine deaminase/5-amino-6-(5-phosphoribosylamino)uracil reductase RibD [Armatimonadota bacterium]|nr:bifunctional diaminohydroxyphosphoribosylaminopyrimidine deaminase/5-amino-6-(5-phosphoribosylamino)uracil reductase RibD [Armatimonadota bacterium]